MGLWSMITGLFGGTGVKAMLWKYSEPLKRSAPVITGAVLLKATKDQTITGVEVKVIEEYTTTEGEGEDKTTDTETTVLGSMKFPGHDAGIGYPLELKAGTQQEQPFTINCTMVERMANQKGIMGGIGKMAAFASGDKAAYFITVDATIKGMSSVASDKQKLKISD